MTTGANVTVISFEDNIDIQMMEDDENLSRFTESCTFLAGALLFDARQLFDQQNAHADEALRSIVGNLPEAVGSCVEAAGADLDPIRQAALLKVIAVALMATAECILLETKQMFTQLFC